MDRESGLNDPTVAPLVRRELRLFDHSKVRYVLRDLAPVCGPRQVLGRIETDNGSVELSVTLGSKGLLEVQVRSEPAPGKEVVFYQHSLESGGTVLSEPVPVREGAWLELNLF